MKFQLVFVLFLNTFECDFKIPDLILFVAIADVSDSDFILFLFVLFYFGLFCLVAFIHDDDDDNDCGFNILVIH